MTKLAVKVLEEIASNLKIPIHAQGYLEDCITSDVRLLDVWLNSLTPTELGRIVDGGDEEIYDTAPKGSGGRPVSFLIEEFTV